MNTSTPEEVRNSYVEALGDRAGGLFFSVKNDYINTRYYWRVYCELFRAYRERIEIMNEASGSVSFVLQQSLFDRVVIEMCRLLDPAEMGKNRNSTLHSLFGSVNCTNDMRSALIAADSSVEPLRKLRNKSLAHRDISHAEERRTLKGLTYADVDKAVEAVSLALREFGSEYLDTHYEFDVISDYRHDEVAFLECLWRGNVAKAELMGRIASLRELGRYEECLRLAEKPSFLEKRRFEGFSD